MNMHFFNLKLLVFLIIQSAKLTTNTPTGCQLISFADIQSSKSICQPTVLTFQQCQSECTALNKITCMYGFDWHSSKIGVGSNCCFSKTSDTSWYPGAIHSMFYCSGAGGPETIIEGVRRYILHQHLKSLFLGCIKDDNDDRSILTTTLVSVVICIKECNNENVSFAALKAGKQCHCIKNYGSKISSKCNIPCFGNKLQTCGGLQESSIYRTSNAPIKASRGFDMFEETGCLVDINPDHETLGRIWAPYISWKECRNACFFSRNKNCKYGFEWIHKNTPSEQCWFSTVNKARKIGTDLYTFTCPGISTPRIIPYSKSGCSVVVAANHICPDNVIHPVVTWEDCRDDCFKLKTNVCKYGFNWNLQNQKDQRCSFSKSVKLNTDVAKHNYKFDCTSKTHVTSTPSKECRWIYLPGITTPGWSVPTETEDQCRDGCFNALNTHCRHGYYWLSTAPIPSERCHFSNKLLLYDSSHSNYAKYECSDLDCQWVRNINTGSFRRSPNPSKNLLECENRCYILRNTKCKYGFDFDLRRNFGMRCLFSDDETTEFRRNSVHYVFSCQKQNYTTSTTTEVPGFSVCNRDNHCDTGTTKCFNYSIGYKCECRQGYYRASSKVTPFHCQDIDECKTLNYWCDINSQCVNTIGSFICSCGAGKFQRYVPSGHSCKNIEFCTNSSCDNKSTICLNMVQGFYCSCLRNMIPYDNYSCVADVASDIYEYEDHTEKVEGLKHNFNMFLASIGSLIIVSLVILKNKLPSCKKTTNSGFSSTRGSIISGTSITTI